jgi:predicted flap endonuclease-1-like 5' DNA nuclease
MKDWEKYKFGFYIAAIILLMIILVKLIQPQQQVQIVNIGTKKIMLSYDNLRRIDGIGDKKAKKIIDYVKKNKKINLYDLTEINGIGETTVKKLIAEGVYIGDRPSDSE